MLPAAHLEYGLAAVEYFGDILSSDDNRDLASASKPVGSTSRQ